MKTMLYLEASSASLEALRAAGYSVEVSTDFDATRELVQTLEKTYLTSHFSPDLHDFTERNAFWLILKDGERPVGCIGARLDDLGRETADSYWRRVFPRIYPEGGPITATLSGTSRNLLTGRLAYIGDLFFARDHRGRQRVLSALLLLTHAMVAVEWRPGATYAFMRGVDVRRGFGVRYHFTVHTPPPHQWDLPPEHRSNDEWVVILPEADHDAVFTNGIRELTASRSSE